MKRIGRCNDCGACCENVQFMFRNLDPKHASFYSMFDGISAKVIGDTTIITIKAKCKHLGWKDGKSYCAIYENRPEECRAFPWRPDQISEKCGYKIIEEEKMADLKRVGECNRCGKCCQAKNLFASFTPHDLTFLKRTNFPFYMALRRQARLGLECPHLTFDKTTGKASCSIYEDRPPFCRGYPATPADLVEGCGFSFVKVEKHEIKSASIVKKKEVRA